ncbi:SGNH/GDSL hydrolase family protein [Sphingomonas sp. R-74633]|uniref:SGNH/GDSL hydrolase family protein n=1 Tax=Sphingomonas sp. R-74633 TaxID=2751188 RepID=UPI0015D0FB9E|nr:SGNH/GDSL hydrolase family protein [Sphingomonas sp. R-74633]NYT39228.1 SGNH/GDSL hydrolase family protein [Sphingomonas sp. R-74633]
MLYEQSYIAQLKAANPDYDVIHYGHGGATIERLFNYTSYFHRTVRPDFCFVQSGIVDCAPRALKEIELQAIKALPLVGRMIGKLVQKNAATIRKFRKLSYTPIDTYRVYLDKFEQTFGRIWWITIPPASSAYEQQLPGITAQVDAYNQLLEVRPHVATADFTEAEMMSDFHHLSVAGHKKLFARMNAIVRDRGAGSVA